MPIEQETFARIRDVLTVNGIPNDDRELADVIFSITGQDPYRHITGDAVIFPEAEAVREAYRVHRASHRIASFGQQHAFDGFAMYLGRESANQGARQWRNIYDVLSQITRISRGDEAHALTTMPFVITEQNRFNRNPMDNNDPVQHATLQLLHLEGMGGNSGIDRRDMANPIMSAMLNGVLSGRERVSNMMSIYFDVPLYNTIIQDTVIDLEAEGWTLVKRTFQTRAFDSNELNEVELVIGAICPEEMGRHAIMLLNVESYTNMSVGICEIMLELYRRIPEIEDVVISEETIGVLTIVQQARAATAGIRRNMAEIEQRVQSQQSEVENLRSSLSSYQRNLHDDQQQLTQMVRGMENIAIDSVMAMSRLPEIVSAMNPVDTVELESNATSVVLTVTTHPFGMRLPAGRYRTGNDTVIDVPERILYVVPIKFTIDMMGRTWGDAIKISARDDRDRFHPHGSGSGVPCWGSAGNALSEAWSRRDWESFVRIVLGWCTQFDPNDQLTRVQTIIERRGIAPRTGWLLPDADGNVVMPVGDDDEHDELDEEEMDIDEQFVPA